MRPRRRPNHLHPIHASYRTIVAKGGRLTPRDMDRLTMSHAQFEVLQNVALDIFVDASNAGVPFQEAIAAIYLSGLQHGRALSEEKVA